MNKPQRQRDIFWFWLPLFASWLLMTAEGPIISAAINRLPDEVIMLAAQGIVMSLSVMIESPIINILATSTALVQDYASYRLVRKFTITMALILTVVAALVAFTPLFQVVVVTWLEAPPEVARWVRPGMQIMTLWSAAIAWRRFLQGIMIRFGQTRKVAWGTAVRLFTSGGTVVVLAFLSNWPGVIIGATALIVGVIAEAAYATVAVRPLLQTELHPDKPSTNNDPLTYRSLFWFHLPLAATSLLILLAQPLVTSSLARLPLPTESLAAWPVLFQMMLMARAAALALPEVVIALSKNPNAFMPIRRFTVTLSVAGTLLLGLLIFTPAARFYLFTVQDMTPAVGELAVAGLQMFLFFPALATVTSWLRGLLINNKKTKLVNWGMGINLVITAVTLLIGLLTQQPGLPTAAVALNLASLAEVVYLGWRASHVLPMGKDLWRPMPARDWGLEIGD
ncbi:MAG: hypothetical protein H6660_12840 [Ardenticatenaceae bacterium]|nr:hypothetical protein [Ardenticatenaceae bacterium]